MKNKLLTISYKENKKASSDLYNMITNLLAFSVIIFYYYINHRQNIIIISKIERLVRYHPKFWKNRLMN